MYGPELFFPCFCEAVGRVVVQPELLFYPEHGVVGPHCVWEVWDLVLPHRTEVAVYALGNSSLGVRGRILWLPGQ